MSTLSGLIDDALREAARERPATEADWTAFERRLRTDPPTRSSRRWLAPAAAALVAVAVAAPALLVGGHSPDHTGVGTSGLTVSTAPVTGFDCGGSLLATTAVRLPDATALGAPIDIGIAGDQYCVSTAAGNGVDTLAPSGPLRGFIAMGAVDNITAGVVDDTVTGILFTPSDPAVAPTQVTTVVDLGGGLRAFYVPVGRDGTVSIQVGATIAVSTFVKEIHGDPAMYPTPSGRFPAASRSIPPTR